jgi:hypothetical protein
MSGSFSAASARGKKKELTGWALSSRSLHVSQMTANWGRAAFQADEYILGIIANFVRKNFPFRSPGLPVLLVSFPDPKFLFPVI